MLCCYLLSIGGSLPWLVGSEYQYYHTVWSSAFLVCLIEVLMLSFEVLTLLRLLGLRWEGGGKPSGMLLNGLVMQDWWHLILKCSRSVLFGSIVSLVANTWSALTPHAQRMKSLEWSAAVVLYSLSLSCSAWNLIAAAFTIGIIFEGLLVPGFTIVSTSQGAAKKAAEPGYVTASDSSMASIVLTSSLLEHSWVCRSLVLPDCKWGAW